ncbi:MAG TPA: hypothetical protein GXX36_01585 [Clostridiaceae bacterium]|nr:hypothetical protein [Clostridiaceae bacterium]
MNIVHNEISNFSIKKSEMVFFEGHSIKSLSILNEGQMGVYISPYESFSKVDEKSMLENSYRIFDIGQQSFIGICSMLLGKEYLYTYKSTTGTILSDFGIQNVHQLKSLMDSQEAFRNNVINSVLNIIYLSCKALDDLKHICTKLKILADNFSVYYWWIWEKLNIPHLLPSPFMETSRGYYYELKENGFSLSSEINPDFLEKNILDSIGTISDLDNSTDVFNDNISSIEYYKSISNLQRDISVNFFGSDPKIAFYGCTQASECLVEIIDELKKVIREIHTHLFERLLSETNECILSEYYKLAAQSAGYSNISGEVFRAIRCLVTNIREKLSELERKYDVKPKVDINRFNDIYLSGKSTSKETAAEIKDNRVYIEKSMDTIPEELKGSLKKILAYSGIQEEKANEFMIAISNFRALLEGNIPDSEFKNIRTTVTPLFFEIYKAVFKRFQAENNKSRLLSMFLNFGYMDEKLLTCEQVNSLYALVDKQPYQGRTPVYNMEDWLKKIYSMEKDPSCNEFGFDYLDIFRNLKKQGKIRDEDKHEYLHNIGNRLDFEIDNMFKTNHKLCHGHISSYFPVLNKSMVIRDLPNAIVTPDAVNQCIERILEIDFSAFHRELSYNNPEKGIEKEIVIKAIIPDVILVPIYGSRAMMWQELSGRDRNTPGRFILPIFTNENLYDLMVKLVGDFRWELCRTMMGVYWNDITLKSLTSEYSDYIQFYKKDRSLSETAKIKIKTQIQKNNGKLRDIFTSDYEVWINYESKGIARLNKTVRNIMYHHCPFSKPIRDRLENFPAFVDIASHFRIVRAKKAKELESRYQRLIKSGIRPDDEQLETLKFYKEL